MDITIRKAKLGDLEALMTWRMTVLHEVFSIPQDDPMEVLEQKNRLYYQTALPSGEHTACFAMADDKIIGCGGICFQREMPSPDNPDGGCAYLMNIYTCPEFRGKGVGRKVVNWLIQQAQSRGIEKIYLETSEIGRSLYQEIGFTDMQGYMKLSVK
ncbi:GNAT family N-acetyltransferase [Blautia schinkii]|nr:GNAT family N-acetyltransferase [Blautia schinkii]